MNKKLLLVINILLYAHIVVADEFDSSMYITSPSSKMQNVIRGQLKAKEFTVISAGLSGKLIKFPVVHGQRVTKGQKLAVFNCKVESAEKAIALAKLSAAQSKLASNKELEKYNNISHLDVMLSKAELAIQRAELKRAKAILSDCTIFTPFSGIVVEKFTQSYQYVREGDPLLELVNTSDLEIEMVIPSKWLAKLEINTVIHIKFDELFDAVEAKISRNMGIIDPVSQTIRIVAELVEPSDKFLPGMSGTVSFVKEELVSSINNGSH